MSSPNPSAPEIESLINYGIKEGFIDDSAEEWTDEEKIAYYDKCQMAEDTE